KPLIARAEIAKGTPSITPAEDFPGPIPKEGTFKPSLSVEQVPTAGVLPAGQEGKEVESRRVTSRSLNPPQRLPAIPQSSPDQSPLLEVEKPRVLTLAERGGIPTDSTTLEKITAPLGRNRPHAEVVSDLLPIPTVKSPASPEEREMMLARQRETPRSHIGKSMEPFLTGFRKKGTFVGKGKGFSILLVLDTSGSVKGTPLEGIKKSAMEFVNLLGESDRGGVITFNDEASLVAPFTSDKNALKQKIAGLTTKGRNTVLFDALDQAFLLLEKEKGKERFVVLFSDGKDEGSTSTPGQVINKARKSEIAVFCLGYSRVERKYLQALESLSQSTGGIFAEAPHFGEIVELFKAARDVKDKRES
ncbi:MAG: VWA domain-containing protein, partial [Deltaproteobacteria bacterium]|nr:VWA domain-containing protein [Deltaproteobacteria bacterium]